MDGFIDCPILPDRYLINQNGDIYSKRRRRFIATRLDRYGYVRVNLYKGTKNHTVTLHRLLALAFIPNDDPTNKKEVNHKDGNKLNYDLSNLEWVTSSENQIHAFDNGLQQGQVGESNGSAKYTESDAIEVCERLNNNESIANIIKQTGFSRSFVEKIKYGECWTHISQHYGITPKAKRATTRRKP